jgi:pimeloyl-ACP methyl ester carboxylesterase
MAQRLVRIFGVLLMASALALALSRAPDRPVQSLIARWAQPPSDFVELGGQLVHLRDVGPHSDAAPIVLVHGTGASLHTWEGWVQALRGQRRVISFDLPGFGLTGPSAAGDYHGEVYARFVLALMDSLKVQRFVIGGNSLGGEVAWRVAVRAPDRVQGLVLVDASGYPFRSESMPIGFRVARLPLLNRIGEWLLPRGLVEASVADVYGDPKRVTPELVDRYFELTLREGNRRALAQRFQALADDAARFDTDQPRIKALRLPTLVVWGGRDRLIPPAIAQRFIEDIPGAQLALFPELGHVPQEEDPLATVAAVKAFLDRR